MADAWDDFEPDNNTEQAMYCALQAARRDFDAMLAENRQLWAAVAHLKEQVGVYDAACRTGYDAESWAEMMERADEADRIGDRVNIILDQMVPLTTAAGRKAGAA